jgi:chemotaxis protein histidine kinase CheA
VSEHTVEFLQIFRDEAEMRLDRMTAALIGLEAGTASADAVDSLFRDAHSIKGGAGMLELTDVLLLANAVEDLLAGVRASGSFPVELTDPLLRATDMLRAQVAGTVGASGDLIAELVRMTGEPVAAADPPRETEHRTLRVPADQIDKLLEVAGEAMIHQRRLEHSLDDGVERRSQVAEELAVVERLLDELKSTAIGMRALPLNSIVGPLPRMLRDLAAAAGKEAELVVTGAETLLDRVILESLADLLVHVLRNAVGHGLETPSERVLAGKPPRGRVELRAEQHGQFIEIAISDDGRGVAPVALAAAREGGSLVDVLTRPGYSTAGEVSSLSGRGVGLDVVKTRTESFGGSLDVRSEPGVGTTIVLVLPLALSLLDALLFERGANVFGVPLSAVEEVVTVSETQSLQGRREVILRDRSLPIFDVATLVGSTAPALRERSPALVLTSGGRRVVASCDALLGEQELVVKPLGSLVGSGGYLGAAILGDGRIALLLEPAGLMRGPQADPVPALVESEPAQKILVVEDSFTVRELQRSILEAAGYSVVTGRDGIDALAVLARNTDVALVVTDLEMPELDGLGLTRAIRANPSLAGLPVVVVSSHGSPADHQRGIDAGADAYMSKQSYDQRTLLETVQRLIGSR